MQPYGRDGTPPVLVVTADEMLADALARALDRLGWPALRVLDGAGLARVSAQHELELVLIDARSGVVGPAPLVAGDPPGAMTPWLDLPPPWCPGDAKVTASTGDTATATLTDWIAAALAARAQARLLAAADQLLGPAAAPVPIPPAMRAAQRLDWLCVHRPSLAEAARVVARQENLAKQVLRLAQALGAGAVDPAWSIERVLLNLGLLRFIPLVKIVAARLLFPVRASARRQNLEAIWRFSLARAEALRALTCRSVHDDAEAQLAFHAGLLGDAGASLLVWLADQSAARPPTTSADLDLAAPLVAQHPRLGRALLARWGQDQVIVGFAGGHHHDDDAQGTTLSGRASLAAAIAEDALGSADPTGTSARPSSAQPPLSPGERRHLTSLVRREIDVIDSALAS